jgi:hypothetical protein
MKAIGTFVWLFPLALVSSACNGGADTRLQ